MCGLVEDGVLQVPGLPFCGQITTAQYTTFTALEAEPGSRIVYRADFAGLQPVITYRVETAGAGARFTRTVEMQPHGFAKLMAPMRRMMVPWRNRLSLRISSARSRHDGRLGTFA